MLISVWKSDKLGERGVIFDITIPIKHFSFVEIGFQKLD